MTRESKLALIIGFVLVLVVGVLVSDHFSQANNMILDVQQPEATTTNAPITQLGSREKQGINSAIGNTPEGNEQIAHRPVEIPSDGTGGRSLIEQALDAARNVELPKAAAEDKDKTQPKIDEPIRPLPTPKYSVYKVVSGDSLIKIARRLLNDGERWKEIHTLNADVLGPDAILKIGMELKVPADARVANRTTTRSDRSNRSNSNSASTTTYTVASGDTLGEISMRLLGTSRRADEIAELNGLESANDIRIGMKLKIPTK
mgnify:CR=1 FL=1